jgi:hypothetical protein
MKRVKIYTLDEVSEWFKNHKDPKRYNGWQLRNDMILRVNPYYDGPGGMFIQLPIILATDDQVPFIGGNMNHAIWRIMFELTDLLMPKRKREGVNAFELLTDVPLRVAAGNINGGEFIDCDGSLTFFGHFIEDRFIRLRDLIDMDRPARVAKDGEEI